MFKRFGLKTCNPMVLASGMGPNAFFYIHRQDEKKTALNSALPAFLAMILIPLTFSITQGMVIGPASHYLFIFFRKVIS
jgi:xanthine/uracil/vitamin C permease (AzgA family)